MKTATHNVKTFAQMSMTHNDRRSFLVARAIALGVISASSPAARSHTSHHAPHTSGDTLSPIPHDSRSPFASEILSKSERARLALDVKLARDSAAWNVGKRGRTWLLVIAPVVAVAVEIPTSELNESAA